MRAFIFGLALLVCSGAAQAADPVLTPDRGVKDKLTLNSRLNDNGGRSQDYRLRLQRGQLVAISAKSDDFDTMLILFGPDGDVVASNDDRDNSANSLIVTVVDTNGDYIVRLNSLSNPSPIGNYSLKASVINDD